MGKFAERTCYLSIIRAIKRWGVPLRLAERKSLLDVWIPNEYHRQKITLENREVLPAKAASALCLSNGKRKRLCRITLAILLNARDAQTSETMSLESALPGEELFDRELVGTACLLDRDPAATHGRDHRGLTMDAPPLGVWMWQLLQKLCSARRLTRGRFHQEPPGGSGSRLAPAGPACDRTSRKDSCMLAASLFHGSAI